MRGPTATFILGRAGAGKSRWTFDRIGDLAQADPLGPPILLLVPPQATFETERHIALALAATLRVHVVDPEGLANLVLRSAGGDAGVTVDAVGRQLLLGHLLRVHGEQLTHFRAAADRPGTAARVDAALAEISRTNQTPGQVLDRLAGDAAADPDLVAKFRDLALIGDAYAKLLGDRRDPDARFDHALGRVATAGDLDGARLLVDGFRAVRGFERRLIAEVAARCRETFVTLTLDPAEPNDPTHANGLFARASADAAVLRDAFRDRGVAVKAPVSLHINNAGATPSGRRSGGSGSDAVDAPAASGASAPASRFTSSLIALVERDWLQPRGGSAVQAAPDDVRFLEAADARGEAEAAVAQVKDWTLDGCRLRDCAVLFRRPEPYGELLATLFEEANLPFFVDRRRPARHHAAVRLVRSILAVAADGWRHADAMALAKNPLAGLDARQRDTLEAFALDRRLRGRRAWESPRPWEALAGDPPEVAETADEARRHLLHALRPLLDEAASPPDRPLRQHADLLRDVLDRFAVADALAADGDAADRQAYEATLDVVRQAVELIGDEAMSLRRFADLIDASLDRVDFAVPPPTVDAVLLADVTRVVLPAGVKRCVVVGLADGVFPPSDRPTEVLGEADRRRLRDLNVDIEDADDVNVEERRLIYRATTLAGERLTLTRPIDRPPSTYWTRLCRLLRATPEPAQPRVTTAGQAAARSLAWAVAGGDVAAADAHLYNVARHLPATRAAWRSLDYANQPRLQADTRDALLGDALVGSVGRVEDFAACPFRHFARHGLSLHEPPSGEATPRDVGLASHQVLEALVEEAIANEIDLANADDVADLQRRLPAIARGVAGRLRGGIFGDSARGRYLLGRVERELQDVIDGQRAALSRGRARPIATNVAYGEGGPMPPVAIATPRGRVVQLTGLIDRVDVTPAGSVAVDYRGATGNVARRIELGLSLRLVAGLLALRGGGDALGETAGLPIAALEVGVRRKLDKVDDPAAAPEPPTDAFHLRHKPRGLIDYAGLPLLDEQFADYADDASRHVSGKSEVYAVNIKKDGTPGAHSDVLPEGGLDALLDAVEGLIAALGDAAIDGAIEPLPYRVGTDTACAHCGYLAVCRFDPPADRYRTPVSILPREEA